MRTLSFNIPDNFDLDDREVAMLIATRLYEKGKLSLGQVAELVGLTKRTFAELLGKYDVSIFNYPAIAERLGLKITGTIGVIVKAKLNNIIPSIKPLLFKIRQTDFRLSTDIEKQALK